MVAENLFTDIQWHLANQPDVILDWWGWIDLQAPCDADWQDLNVAPPPLWNREVFAELVQAEMERRQPGPQEATASLVLIWQLRDCLAALDEKGYLAALSWLVLGLSPYQNEEDPHYPLVQMALDYMSGALTEQEFVDSVRQFAFNIPVEDVVETYGPSWRNQMERLIAKGDVEGRTEDAKRLNSLSLSIIARYRPSTHHWSSWWLDAIFKIEGLVDAGRGRWVLTDVEKTIQGLLKSIPEFSITIESQWGTDLTYVNTNSPLLHRFLEWWWRHTLCAASWVQEKLGPQQLLGEARALIERARAMLQAVGPDVVVTSYYDYFGDWEAPPDEEVDVVEHNLAELPGPTHWTMQTGPWESPSRWRDIASYLAGTMASWYTAWISPVARAIKDTPEGAQWKDQAIQLWKDVRYWYEQARMHPELVNNIDLVPPPSERSFQRNIESLEQI